MMIDNNMFIICMTNIVIRVDNDTGVHFTKNIEYGCYNDHTHIQLHSYLLLIQQDD